MDEFAYGVLLLTTARKIRFVDKFGHAIYSTYSLSKVDSSLEPFSDRPGAVRMDSNGHVGVRGHVHAQDCLVLMVEGLFDPKP